MADDRHAGDWFIGRDGQSHGPASWDELLELFRAGQVSATDFVWREGLDDWVALGTLVGPATPPLPTETANFRSLPTQQSISYGPPAAPERRKGGRRRTLVGAAFVAAILAAAAVGYGVSFFTRDSRDDSQARNDRTDSHPRATASAALAERRESASQPFVVPLPGDPAPRRPASSNEANPSAAGGPLQQPGDASPGAIDQGKGPAPRAKETPAKDPPQSAEVPDGAASGPPPKASGPPTTDVKPPPAKEPATEPTQPGARTLFQEVLVARRPSFDVSGVTISQDLQYRVISKLLVGPRSSDGKIEVKQTIYETKLEKSEQLTRAAFEESLRALRGQEFRYTLGKENEVVKFTGPKDNRKVVKADGLGGEGFLLSSVMDDDAWKELAQLSFFQPPSPLKRGQRFERKITHDWGALGAWYGKTIYNPMGEKDGEHRIDYAHYLHYMASEKKDKQAPFEVVAAKFKIEQASGTIHWNPKAARITGVTERFVVRGTVTARVLGQDVEANVEESQAFALRIMDKLPFEKSK